MLLIVPSVFKVKGNQDGSFDSYLESDCREVSERKQVLLEYEPFWENVKRDCKGFSLGVSKKPAVPKGRKIDRGNF